MKVSTTGNFTSSFFLFLIVFFNYYNPINVYLTLIINLTASFLIFSLSRSLAFNRSYFIVLIPTLIFLYVGFLSIFLGSVDVYVAGKYFRVWLSCLLLYYIFNNSRWTINEFFLSIAAVLFAHVLFIYLQIFFPSISIPMAGIFGMTGADDFFSEYSNRKMGLSSSFDTASFISLLSFTFFTLSFKAFGNFIFLFLALFSFGASFMSSRLGMLLAILIFFFLFIPAFVKSGTKLMLLIGFFIISIIFYLSFDVIFSIVLHSMGSDSAVASPVLSEYGTTGTVNHLFGSHLLMLFELNNLEYIFGKGVDPDGTDIGYVKLIFHIGVIGTLAITFLYILAFVNIKKMDAPLCTRTMIIRKFFLIFIILTFFMNYKSLELYSRGSTELFVIIYVFLVSSIRSKLLI